MELFQILYASLHDLGVWAYLALFVIALADSLIIVGSFTAGGLFLMLAGTLAEQGVYSTPYLIIASSIGAILGSSFSFYLGRAQANFVRRKRWFPKEKNLERGAQMLAKRGGASILIARFLGPVSSVMAFVAGTARMPQHRFHAWNILAGIVWSSVFILLGSLLSSLSHVEMF